MERERRDVSAKAEEILRRRAKRRSGETVAALRKLHKRMRGLPRLTDKFLKRAKNEGQP